MKSHMSRDERIEEAAPEARPGSSYPFERWDLELMGHVSLENPYHKITIFQGEQCGHKMKGFVACPKFIFPTPTNISVPLQHKISWASCRYLVLTLVKMVCALREVTDWHR